MMMEKVEKAAKTANGRSRMCAKCPFNTKPKSRCTEEIYTLCSTSFVTGFRKGANWIKTEINNKKNGKENCGNKSVLAQRVDNILKQTSDAKDNLGSVGVKVIPEVREHQAKALNALNKLFTIAEAWNKADNFIPDFSNRNQYKYFPWFVYDNAAGFVCAGTYYTTSFANAPFGSRLCFSTSERAEQFRKQFIDLWNDFLLFQ